MVARKGSSTHAQLGRQYRRADDSRRRAGSDLPHNVKLYLHTTFKCLPFTRGLGRFS